MSESEDKNESELNINEYSIYPKKPKDVNGFKKAVAWFGGRELIASLKGTIIYAIYGENIDPRNWMNPNIYPNIAEKVANQKEMAELQSGIEAQEKDTYKTISSEVLQKTYTEIKADAIKEISTKKSQADISLKVKQEWKKQIEDQWKWKKKYYTKWEKISEAGDFWKKLEPNDNELEEIWFDFIADSGDGQLGVYNVACLCLSDLWVDKTDVETFGPQTDVVVKFHPPEFDENNIAEKLDKKTILPRGAFLFVGGDTAYHVSNYQTLFERFQVPFQWAFTSVREFTAKIYGLKSDLIDEEKENTAEIKLELEGSIPGVTFDAETKEKKSYFDTEPLRPIFGIPGNHDYYDSIDGFNRQFRKSPFKEFEENIFHEPTDGKSLLKMPTFTREQEASFIALRLPFDWWMFGIDSENEKLDFRQKLYFQNIVEKQNTKKLILATPEPTTVFGKEATEDDKTAIYLKTITESLGLKQPFFNKGKISPIEKDNKQNETKKKKTSNPKEPDKYCRLDLSGDVHHYARYWGENSKELKNDKYYSENYASVVAGGGGAFFDVTSTLLGKPDKKNSKKEKVVETEKLRGQIPPQSIYPGEKDSIEKTAHRLFDMINIRRGGYIHLAGAVISFLIFYLLNYYSNASNVFNQLVRSNSKLTWNNITADLFATTIILIFIAVFIGISAYLVRGLIDKLKENSFKGKETVTDDARMKRLALCYVPLACAVIGYVAFYYYVFRFISSDLLNLLGKNSADQISSSPEYFLISFILLLHLIIFLLIIWLSFEHTTWLSIRFKIFRKNQKPTFTQKLDNPNIEFSNPLTKLIARVARLYSYQYIFPNLLVITAITFFVSGLSMFGNVGITKTFADGLLILLILALFVLIVIVLGVKTGAKYHIGFGYKVWFSVFGLFHFILQIAIPFVLFFVGSWTHIFVNFALVWIINGSATFSYFVRKLFVVNDEESKWKKLADFRVAAWLTQLQNRYLLFLGWMVYGGIILLMPYLFPVKTSAFESLQNFASQNIEKLPFNEYLIGFYQWLQIVFQSIFHTSKTDFNLYFVMIISLVVVSYIGYLMSRVWFSWYLAVSMLFDGHNNEAGGAARIEGYKHILRVRVEEDEMTVYVIGFEKPEAEFEKLDLRLVDKFTLKCQPLPDQSGE